MLTREQRADLLELTRDFLLAVRADYLAADMKRAQKHWTQIENAAKGAALRGRRTASLWAGRVTEKLNVPASSRSICLATDRLVEAVDGHGLSTDWIGLVRTEIGLVMAMARLEAEERKEAREKKAVV